MSRKVAIPLIAALSLSACNSDPRAEGMATTNDSAIVDTNETASAPATDLIFCPEVGRRLTRQDCDDLTGVANNAASGVAAFNAPDKMVRDKPVVLELAVGFGQPEAAPAAPAASDTDSANAADADMADENGANVAAANLPRPAPAPSPTLAKPQKPEDVVGELPGKVVSYSPIVGRFMRATLTGAGFEIKPLSPESQEVFRDSQTVWQWQVTPQKRDPHILTLTTVVEGVTQDGKHYPLRSTTRSQSVTIERTLWQKIWDAIDAMPALLKAVTAVVVALTALVTAIVALRKAFGKHRAAKPKGR